jgi:hypothetical protein
VTAKLLAVNPVLSLPWYTAPGQPCRIWAQGGDEPAGSDHLVGSFTDAEVALRVVKDHNRDLAGL